MEPGSRPEPAALRHLQAELDHLRALLVGHLRRLQRAGLAAAPDAAFPGTTLPDAEALARAAAADRTLDAADQDELARADAIRKALVAETPDLPLVRLRQSFALDDDEALLLLMTLAPELDPAFARLYALVHDHFERGHASLALLAAVSPTAHGPLGLRWLLDRESTLRRHALIRLDPREEHLPTSQRALHADPRIVRWVQGFRDLDEALAGLARLEPASRAPTELVLSAADDVSWRRLQRALDEPVRPFIGLRGPAGVGKHTWSRAAAKRLGLDHLRVDLPALVAEHGGLERGLRVALREARLQGAALCLDGWSRLHPSADERARESGRLLQRVLGQVPLATLTLEDSAAPTPLLPSGASRPLVVFDLTMPDLDASMRLWKQYLPRDRPKAQGLTLKRLAQSFRLSAGHVQEAIAAATAELAPGDPRGDEGLSRAIKGQTRHRLGESARLVERDYQWSDLIVPPDVELQLRELVGRWQAKSLVFETWGLGRRFATGQGVSVLFEGAPGTGKTMAASIVARELDLDLYQIDLSKVVNRYVGETEKSLGRIFDEAERLRVMLLFDEADALFSSRTTVKSANDRYANLEVNYLLQRIETFTGIAVLTTNFPAALDEAFRRRIAMRVSFPKPQLAERKRLWDSMFVNKQILSPKLDTEDLAYEFELSGGQIKNAVLRAAFIAATRGERIDLELCRIAARIELKEQGLLVHGSPYEELRNRESPS
ncbi:MAG: AAA family ATPase [Myxococcota bacterium]